ncbi:neuroligin-4, X-linked-like isoform X3 [Rhodnius prolixus]|uniref:neuroligin-4, X-linked-like isoform X3 n=1 Tax=Rhodnius prolixus TaxID=13249 RepID=UPI003D187FD6
MTNSCVTPTPITIENGARGIEAPYAVMVYLHGESYEWNSGNHYDGRVLASFGHVIFITVNFRLGLLGFLRAGSGVDTPLAMGDVMAALRWIKENIGSFGGDPKRVTLMGHDTGAALANLLLISPQAKGLFCRVALVSGSILSPWAISQDPIGLRERVSNELGCKNSAPNKEDLVRCLRGLPLSAIINLRPTPPRFLTAIGPWTSRVEPSVAVEGAGEPFLSSQLLLGTTSTESYLDLNNQDIQYGIEEDQRNRVLRTYVRNAYVYHLNEIFSTVRNEYTDWEKPIQHPINLRDSTLEALSDGHTVAPLLRLAYLHSRRGAPTYFYHFNYQTKESDYPQRLGSVRGEDVNYLLGLPLVGGYPYFPQNYTSQDHKVAESVLIFFTNFAKTGDPNEPRRQEGISSHGKEKGRHRGFQWDLYEPATQLYLSLSTKPRMKSHYRGHKMAIWLNLIPQLHQPGDQDVSMRHHHFHERANHYYSGAIRGESFTRVPPTVGSGSTSLPGEPLECPPNVTGASDEPLSLSDLGPPLAADTAGRDDETDVLEKHYYSTSTAFGVTVGVGCLLLVLNLLIFSAIYYQRRRQNSSRESASAAQNEQLEIKTLSECSSVRVPVKQPPVPPVRTSSVPPPGTVKKRVQIQEISV